VVIGRAGAGKSTIALQLGRQLGVPVVHLDRLYWDPEWQPVAPEVFAQRQAAAIADEAWVIDGGYLSSPGWNRRLERAELVVLVEAPLATCLWRIVRRSVSQSGTRRPDLPEGCEEALSLAFLRWTIGWRRRHRETIAQIERTRPLVRIRSGRAATIQISEIEGSGHAPG
jgi:adenylate kinase family enzyme